MPSTSVSHSSMRLTKAAFVFLGVVWGSNFIYMKWATALISPMQVAFLRVLFGFFPLALATWQMGLALLILYFLTDFSGMSRLLQDWRATAGVVIGLGTLGTGAAFLIYYYLLEKMGAVASSSSNYLAPAVALMIGWAAGERFELSEVVAIAFIFISVALVQIGQLSMAPAIAEA